MATPALLRALQGFCSPPAGLLGVLCMTCRVHSGTGGWGYNRSTPGLLQACTRGGATTAVTPGMHWGFSCKMGGTRSTGGGGGWGGGGEGGTDECHPPGLRDGYSADTAQSKAPPAGNRSSAARRPTAMPRLAPASQLTPSLPRGYSEVTQRLLQDCSEITQRLLRGYSEGSPGGRQKLPRGYSEANHWLLRLLRGYSEVTQRTARGSYQSYSEVTPRPLMGYREITWRLLCRYSELINRLLLQEGTQKLLCNYS